MKRRVLSFLFVVLAYQTASTQSLSYSRGQNVSPAFEGWEKNDDGSFNMMCGYMNRNWEEEVDVPIGADNSFSPGVPDQGQPTHFLPRRNRFVFKVRVPANFGSQEIVWTLTNNGETEKAYGTLKPAYAVDETVMMANFGAGGQTGFMPDMMGNKAPELKLDGVKKRTAKVGEAVAWPSSFLDLTTEARSACRCREAGSPEGGRAAAGRSG